ncbi:MAG: hypothetical protein AABY39_10445 [Nitrospirota bacterium]
MQAISHIDKKTEDALHALAKDITTFCADNMVSFYLYGSAAGKGYVPGRSNLNTLILLKDINPETLKGLAQIYKKRRDAGFVAPLILTPDYIKSSIDVFPIEFLDIRDSSILLAGEDTIKNISVNLSYLREECEREIKGQLIRMRSSFIEVEGDKKRLEALIISAISNIVFPLKNILRLTGQEIPDGNDAIIKACCKTLNAADKPLLDAWTMKKEGREMSAEGLSTLISEYLNTLNDISKKIDLLKIEGRL